MGQYNRLGQRRASGAWQWLIIGFIPGILCGGLILFGLLLGGVLNGFGGEPETVVITSEPIRIVVTTTPDPLATSVVQVVTATSAPTEEAVDGAIVQPTLTPFNTPVEVNSVVTEPEESATPAVLTSTDDTNQAVIEPTTQTQVDPVSNTSNIPAELAGVISPLREVAGGVFQYGADSIEIVQSAQLCITRDSGTCTPEMGEDSTPQVQIELDTFWIEPNEVTFNQYEAFLNYLNSQGLRHLTGCQGLICIQTQNERPTTAVLTFDGANYRIPANYETLRNHPAYGVTWYGAQAYCQAIGRRLPTEAEWEYAARNGGDSRIYPWGDNWTPDNANVRQPLSDGVDATVAITDFGLGVNPLGLSHMAGNVAEWVNDYYLDGYYQTLSSQSLASGQPVLNPTGPAGGTQRVLRGGSFNSLPFFARTVHRQSYFPAPETPNESNYPLWVGFRCASDTGDAGVPATSDQGVSPSNLLPTIPAVGNDADTNAQPTAPVDTESESSDGEESRG